MNTKYKIVTDSSADIIHSTFNTESVSVPMKIIAENKEFVDNQALNIKAMVEYLGKYKGKSSTACPSVMDYLDAFSDAERVICITITGTLSGSYNSACIAKDEYEEKYPNKKVYVLNSLSAGPELKLIIEKADNMVNSGYEFDKICKTLEEYINQTGLVFSLESLNNLANNGRVSSVVAKAAGLLGIRIVGKASDIGDLQPLDKTRGAEKTYEKLFSRMISEGYNGGKVRIDHCYNENGAKKVESLILKIFPNADIKIDTTYGLCSFYAENGGMLIAFEKRNYQKI